MAVWGLSVAPENNMIDLEERTAIVNIAANIQSHQVDPPKQVQITASIFDATGSVVCTVDGSTMVDEMVTWTHQCKLTSVQLWSPDDPYLYV